MLNRDYSIIEKNFKGGWEDEKSQVPRVYGSASCDGLISLKSIGYKGEVFNQAFVFAKRINGFDHNFGLPQKGWGQGMLFYYYLSFSRLYKIDAMRLEKTQVAVLKKKLEQLQSEDGSWKNKSRLMREDDPLIATSFALSAYALINKGFKRKK